MTVVPAGPWEGLNDIDGAAAFAAGIVIAANVIMLRKSNASVALLNLFSMSIRNCCNEVGPLHIGDLLADIRFDSAPVSLSSYLDFAESKT
jgi:hypothetical protein